MNLQEIFDTVARHLQTQNERALHKGLCQYRTADGLKCAVGCLIPDTLYDSCIEGVGIVKLIEFDKYKLQTDKVTTFKKILKALDLLGDEKLNLLKDLQKVHDHYPCSRWPEELKDIAQEHNLSSAVVRDAQ